MLPPYIFETASTQLAFEDCTAFVLHFYLHQLQSSAKLNVTSQSYVNGSSDVVAHLPVTSA